MLVFCKYRLFTVLFLWNIFEIESTIITSISKMESLALSEKEMLSVFQTFMRETDDNDGVDAIRRYQDDIKQDDIYSITDGFMENPINAFHFVKRMHTIWGGIISELDCDNCFLHPPKPLLDFQRRLQEIDKRHGNMIHVSSADLSFAALAIVRLWQTYKLNLSQLIQGKILDEQTEPLTVDEVMYICRQLDDDNYYYKEIIWLQELQREMRLSPQSYTDTQFTRVARQLASTYAKAEMPWQSVKLLEKELSVGNDSLSEVNKKKIERDITYFKQKSGDIPMGERNKTLSPDERDVNKASYEALCRGDLKRNVKVTSRLVCIYRPTKLPWYRVKEEILNHKPRVSMMYNVITDAEIDFIKEFALSKLKESTVAGNVVGGTTNYKYRISQTAWFLQTVHSNFLKIAKRIELITGLSTKQFPLPYDAEDLQVLNYGVGGMYEPHEDYFGTPIDVAPNPPFHSAEFINSGDREATWMFYLSDVKAGGATVFTDIKATVSPVKNSAVFWYDIKRNGNLDDRSTHAGCPVLLGSKWGIYNYYYNKFL
ncbi:Prolyl 4-hydroxylase [Mactra antiquata]